MSRANENQVSETLIDRLVDGELDETERQSLLARLEIEPGGWRRCALAFLEAQEWARTFSSTSETFALDRPGIAAHSSLAPGETANNPRQRREPATRRFRRVGILAAGILLAFASGWLASAATRPADFSTAPVQTAAVSDVPKTSEAPNSAAEVSQNSTDHTDLERAQLPVVRLPEDSSRVAEAPLVLSDPVRRELERQGYRVEQRTGLVSMELEDGQSLAVPVDEVELRYVGNRTY
jgi:hypothetical protein